MKVYNTKLLSIHLKVTNLSNLKYKNFEIEKSRASLYEDEALPKCFNKI